MFTCGVNISGGLWRYSWWMVAFVTPISIALAVIQAAIDKNRLAMNILGATVSINIRADRLLSYVH